MMTEPLLGTAHRDPSATVTVLDDDEVDRILAEAEADEAQPTAPPGPEEDDGDDTADDDDEDDEDDEDGPGAGDGA